MRDRPLVIFGAAIALCLAAAALWNRFGPWQTTLEFSGNCGRFRSCFERGAQRTCRVDDTDAGSVHLRPYAPESACDGDWHVLSREFGSPLYAGHGHGDATAGAIQQLKWVYVLQLDARRTDGAFMPDPLSVFGKGRGGYTPRDCAGRSNTSGPASFTAVLGANLDGDPDLDCWSIDETGELRHISRD